MGTELQESNQIEKASLETGEPQLEQLEEYVGHRYQYFWLTIVGHVGMVAGLYAIIVGLHAGVIATVVGRGGYIAALPVAFLGGLIAAVPTIMVALTVGTLCTLIAHVFFRTLKVDFEQPYIGGAVGGGIAFVCSQILFSQILMGTTEIGVQQAIAFYFTMLATVIGQFAGVRGAREVIVAKSKVPVDYVLPITFKYQTIHLLWITSWCAVLFTTLRALGLFTMQFGIFASLWTVAQLISLRIVLHIKERRAFSKDAAVECST